MLTSVVTVDQISLETTNFSSFSAVSELKEALSIKDAQNILQISQLTNESSRHDRLMEFNLFYKVFLNILQINLSKNLSNFLVIHRYLNTHSNLSTVRNEHMTIACRRASLRMIVRSSVGVTLQETQVLL